MKYAARILVSLLIFSVAAVAYAHGNEVHRLVQRTVEVFTGIGIKLNGSTISDDGMAYNNRTYVPIRVAAEALGASVDYDAGTRTVVITAAASSSTADVTALAETAQKLADIRKATAKYLDVNQALRDGFEQSSGMIPDHGYHFMKTLNILRSFELERPSGLIYIKNGSDWQLAAVEYTALLEPSKPILPGGRWLRHEASCHYSDGNELIESNIFACPRNHPRTDAKYTSWHPSAWTFHVWAWYPNPLGLTAGENPLLAPFNVPGVRIEHHH